MQLRLNLTDLNLQNHSTPLFQFAVKVNCGYKKWVCRGGISPSAVSAFCADQLRGQNPETIVSYPLDSRKKRKGLRFMTGQDLKDALEKNPKKDFVVNFVGFACVFCDEVDNLFDEIAAWAAPNSIKSVVLARVNASCNDIPTTVWRNETYPYGWFFPAAISATLPIGKRRQLY
jgi:hypothetical protein